MAFPRDSTLPHSRVRLKRDCPAVDARDYSGGCAISVRVQPRASRDRLGEFRDGALRISVTAPPHDGRANAAVLELLADALSIARSRLRIVRGHASRDKVVEVNGLTGEEVAGRLTL